MAKIEKLLKKKPFRTTIDGYYIHDVRKHARYTFEDFLIQVKYNEKSHCYDILLRASITENSQRKELCRDMLTKFRNFYPKSFNLVILSETQADLLLN